MKLSPFYLMPVPEDGIELLFVDREKEIEHVKRIIAQQHMAIIGILGGPGVGKSSILNVISSMCKKENIAVEKVSVKDYTPRRQSTVEALNVLLIDDVNVYKDGEAVDFYGKISLEKRLVFFADNLIRSMNVIRERNLITTHASVVLPEGLDGKTCGNFLKKRLENFGERYRFTSESIIVGTKRSKGNLRDFLKYCGTAWAFTNKRIGADNMRKAILEIDKEILYALSEAEKEIVRLLSSKSLNVSQLHHELKEKHQIKMTRVTLDSRLSNLEEIGLLVSEKKGFEVRYKTIYPDINISLDDFL